MSIDSSQLVAGVSSMASLLSHDWNPETCREILDAIPAAVYTTDAEGRLTYFNRAAVEFSGRVPDLGTDRWCVTWKLYDTAGSPLPHDQCPMAISLKEEREVRGIDAIAERPDGKRVAFIPYPTLLRDASGRVMGGVNMLVDITERKQFETALKASEERFRRVVSLMPAAVYTIDAPSGQISFYNERAAELWGRRPRIGDSEERFCGSFRLYLPDGTHMPHDETPMAAAMAGHSCRNKDVIIERPDGSRICVLVNIDPLRNADGEICGAINVFVDTTALKEAEKELLRRTNQLATFLDTAAMGLHRVGEDGTILWANDAELEMLGYSGEEYIGQHIARFHADQAVIADILACLKRGQHLRDYEARLRCKDGTIKTVLIDSSVLWEDGRFVHTQCFTRDVSERKRAELDLREMDRRKDEFLATLSHELRNPLAPIRNSVELLGKMGDDADVRQLTQRILRRQVEQMTKLVDELMDLTRVSRGTIVPDMQVMDGLEMIRTSIEASRPLIEAGRHVFTASLPDKPVLLLGDPVRLSQIVANVLNNAAKYTSEGGTIQLSVQVTDAKELSIAVRDTGIGIPADALPRVFDMFTQTGESSLSGASGLGIGLSIARSLARLHGGEIHASSDGPGKGSEFLIRIPIRLPEERPVNALPNKPMKRGAPLRVLVCDDNVDAAQTTAMMLRLHSHAVHVVHDGAAAIEAVQRHAPQVVLLDLSMPGMNGFEVLDRLRTKAPVGLRVIAITGHGLEQHRERCRAAGFDDHLVKPVAPELLEATVNSFWGSASQVTTP